MKANKEELERRVVMVRQMLAAGFGLEEIVEIVGEVWGVGRWQAERYVERAEADPEKLAEEELPHLRARAIEEWSGIYRRALAAGRYREALRALAGRDMIRGIVDERGRPRMSEGEGWPELDEEGVEEEEEEEED